MLKRSFHKLCQPLAKTTPVSVDLDQTFYKRPLPENLVSFSSPQGKLLFKEAMLDGYMENYFSLGEQFIT
jgi:hypothetical protein